jgi:lipopolysaccharide export system protein LptA
MRRYARVAPVLACLAAVTVFGWAASSGWAAAPPPAGEGGTQPPVPVQVSGASRIEYDDASQEWLLTGQQVVVVRDTMRLEAPEIRYNGRARQFNMPQRGTISTPTFEITADRIVANLLARHATAAGHITGRFRLFAPPAHASETAAPPWTTFQADQIEADDRPDARQIVAIGDVIVVRAGLLLRQELRGDHVVLNRAAEQGTVDGHADLVFGATRLRADHIFADLGRKEAEATGHVLLDREDMHGSADRGTYSDSAQTAVLFGHVVITRGRDILTAERVTVHVNENTAIAEGNPQIVAYPPPESRP